MRYRSGAFPRLLALLAATLFAVGPALADKPSWAAGGKHANKGEDRQGARHGFDQDARRVINDYYGTEFRAGNCPPGLAKKHNGCLPPGQAKKWAMGQPLPVDLRYYDLPRNLLSRLPPPPRDHRYVRVAADILLIAVGTSMVVDAIEDIGR